MQFRDLKAQYLALKTEIDNAMLQVAESSAFIMGSHVKQLEENLARYVGTEYCVSCANGTDALTLALKAWGITVGDAVFVPDFTFFSSAEVVPLENATPVFVDVDRSTFNIDCGDLEKKIELVISEGRLRPRAVVSVDLFGLSADYVNLRRIADKYNIYILEDGAQGFGGSSKGKMNCSFGDISTTSFFPAKPLGCYGDGGAVFTDNPEWAELIGSYRIHGKGSSKYDNVRIGLNSRLDTIQAAILNVKLKAFTEFENLRSSELAERYSRLLGNLVITPSIPEGNISAWAQYTIRLKNRTTRDALQVYMSNMGIPTMVYYPSGMSSQTAFKNLCCESLCPVSDELCGTVLSLPMGPYLMRSDQDMVVKTINKFFS